MSENDPPLRLPLHEEHLRLGAVFAPFAGWSMPLRYSSDIAEHRAVREAAGLFDLSHMAEFSVVDASGAGLESALSAPLTRLAVGRAKYALLLADDGGILDDLIVYRLAEERWLVVANAGNRALVADSLGERLRGASATLADVSDDTVLLALQGPRAADVLNGVPFHRSPGDLRRFGVFETEIDGMPVVAARTGYTGEDGFELYLSPEHARPLWSALLEAGAPLGLQPAGLAARDSLRLEAALPLHGQEIGPDVHPLQAGLGWAAPTAHDYPGRDAVAAGPPAGAPVLVGLRGQGRRAARAGSPVLASGETVGRITSGALSPTLGVPIALAFVGPDHAEPGTALDVDVRGTLLTMTVAPLPFLEKESSS